MYSCEPHKRAVGQALRALCAATAADDEASLSVRREQLVVRRFWDLMEAKHTGDGSTAVVSAWSAFFDALRAAEAGEEEGGEKGDATAEAARRSTSLWNVFVRSFHVWSEHVVSTKALLETNIVGLLEETLGESRERGGSR